MKFERIAIREAQKAKHHQHKLGAVLVRGGKIIARAHNFSCVHAEHAVLNKAWRSELNNTVLYVVRTRSNGTLGMAKPCKLCTERMIEAGVKKVVYSTNDGNFETLKLPSREKYEKATTFCHSYLLSYTVRGYPGAGPTRDYGFVR